MLQTLRDKSSGWLATAILALLIVPFAFFGMEQYLFQRNDTFAAKIKAPPTWWPSAPAFWPVTMLWHREEIGADEFRTAFEQARQQKRNADGDRFDARAFESPDNKREVLDQLIDQRLLGMQAAREGIVVSDGMVRQTIREIPAFQIAGKFDPERYRLALASQVPARTPLEFEQLVREGLQQSLLPTSLADSAFVTSTETDRLLKLLGETRDITYARVPAAADVQPVTDAQIQAWYDQHAAQLRMPETVTLEYVTLDAAALPVAALDEAALRQRYEQEKSKFGQPDQRLVSHILIAAPKEANAAAQKAAQDKAAAVLAQARAAGADFAALARTNTDDAGSKAGGGDLGWIAKDGSMPKPFEDAVFAMQPGEIRGPVRTDFGWHIIQLRDARSGQQRTFEQVREQLAKEAGEGDRERDFNSLLGKAVDEVYKSPNTLAGAAKVLGTQVQRTAPTARGGGEGIAAQPAVQRVAFSESMIQDGTVSDPIEIGPNHSVLIRVAAHTPEQPLPLAQARERVIAAIRAERSSKASQAAADALLNEVRGGKPLPQAAAERGWPVQSQAGVMRGAPDLDPALTQAVFSASPAAPGKPAYGKAALQGGQTAVFQVDKVNPGELQQVSESERTALTQQLSQVAGNNDAEALVKALRKRMKITVSENRL